MWKKLFEWVMELLAEKASKKKKKEEEKEEVKLKPYPVGDNTFYWKPFSDSDGNVAVLFPSEMPYEDLIGKWIFKQGTKFLISSYVCRDKEGKHIIRRLNMRRTHTHDSDILNPNGNRPHARSDWSGSQFQNNVWVVAHWKTETGNVQGIESWPVANTNEKTYH